MARPSEELTYTVHEAAVALKMSEDTVRLYISRGELPAMHAGRRIYISRAELEAWVKANATARFDGRPPRPNELRAKELRGQHTTEGAS